MYSASSCSFSPSNSPGSPVSDRSIRLPLRTPFSFTAAKTDCGCFLVLAKLGADTRQQGGETERLGYVIIGARFEAEDAVGIGIVARENNDRLREPVPAQDAHDFTTVEVGQADIHEHQIDPSVLDGLNALGAVFDSNGLKLLVQRKLFRQCVAQFAIIVDDKNPTRVWHFNLPQPVAAPAVILSFDDRANYGNLLHMISRAPGRL